MNEITDWNDEFKVEIRSNDYEQLREMEDEIEQEAIMLTNVECSKRKCEDCENLQNRYSEEDRKIY